MAITIIVTICCVIMGYIDAVIKPAYFVKSLYKILLFITIPNIYMYKTKDYCKIFQFKTKNFAISLFLGVVVFLIILGAYFLTANIFDYTGVTISLTENIGVNSNNLIFVTTYIALINSLLEEFFFRGFAFFNLKKVTSRIYAYIFSSFMFAIYHITMVIGWFDIFVFLISMIGLFTGGLIFIFVNEKNDNIYSSWLIHMFANFAINTIGFILFDII